MTNTLENKQRFFAQYWGQEVFGSPFLKGSWHYTGENFDDIDESAWMNLKPLSSITDEDLIHVARLAHQLPKRTFHVDRSQKDIIYVKTGMDKVGIEYFISVRPKYATVTSTINFDKTDKEAFKSCTTNIGSIQMSSEKPVPYIAIVDYFRSLAYAIPYMGLSVEKQIEYGWIRLS